MAISDEQKQVLLRQAFAPWDEKAWENLEDNYPETAVALMELVALGVGPDEIRQYAADWDYLEGVGAWLARAAAHVESKQAESAS